MRPGASESCCWTRFELVAISAVLPRKQIVGPSGDLAGNSSAAGDSGNPDLVAEALAGLRNQLPLARALGFSGVETYVRWGWVERQRGRLGPSGDYGEAQHPAKGPGYGSHARQTVCDQSPL